MAEQRQREGRSIEEMRERRRRAESTIDGGRRLKLRIPRDVEERLKAEGRSPRWVIKDSARMHELLSDDGYYERVSGVEEVPTRSLNDGSAIKMVLLSKPTEFVQEDDAAREKKRRETEEADFSGEGLGPDRYVDENTRFSTQTTKISHGGRRSP